MMSTSNILHTITSGDNPEDDISHTVKEYCNSPVKITKVTGLICDLPAYHLYHAHCEMLYEYQFYIILFYAQYVTIILQSQKIRTCTNFKQQVHRYYICNKLD